MRGDGRGLVRPMLPDESVWATRWRPYAPSRTPPDPEGTAMGPVEILILLLMVAIGIGIVVRISKAAGRR